ncbi:MAG: 50S ribosomal protein L24e [Candidatus Micrarchaeota archaeon]
MECTFCSEDLPRGTGLIFSKKDGTLSYYCSSKCKKNHISLKREGRRKKWTKSFRVFTGREQAAKK